MNVIRNVIQPNSDAYFPHTLSHAGEAARPVGRQPGQTTAGVGYGQVRLC